MCVQERGGEEQLGGHVTESYRRPDASQEHIRKRENRRTGKRKNHGPRDSSYLVTTMEIFFTNLR